MPKDEANLDLKIDAIKDKGYHQIGEIIGGKKYWAGIEGIPGVDVEAHIAIREIDPATNEPIITSGPDFMIPQSTLDDLGEVEAGKHVDMKKTIDAIPAVLERISNIENFYEGFVDMVHEGKRTLEDFTPEEQAAIRNVRRMPHE